MGFLFKITHDLNYVEDLDSNELLDIVEYFRKNNLTKSNKYS